MKGHRACPACLSMRCRGRRALATRVARRRRPRRRKRDASGFRVVVDSRRSRFDRCRGEAVKGRREAQRAARGPGGLRCADARHRALPGDLGPGIAVDGRPRGPGREAAARGRLRRARQAQDVAVPRVRGVVRAARPRRGADLEASGKLPVPDLPACERAAHSLRRALYAGGAALAGASSI
jgi:hypothetical protein